MPAQNSNIKISTIYSRIIVSHCKTKYLFNSSWIISILAKHEVRSYHVFPLYTFNRQENYILLNKDFGKCSLQSFSLERIIRISYSSD